MYRSLSQIDADGPNNHKTSCAFYPPSLISERRQIRTIPLMVSPQDRRAAVAHVRQAHGASERRDCGLVGQPRSTQQYEAKMKPEDTLPKRIVELAAERRRFGYSEPSILAILDCL